MILAGSGVAGNADGVGSSASFNNPTGLALDAYGNIYVADYVNSKIRKITPTGFVTTVAGSGVLSDIDGTGLAASFNGPDAIAIDAIGNLYVTEWSGGRVRKVSPVGVVTTIAGNGTSGTLDGLGAAANFQALNGITVDKSGNLYVAETDGNRIRKINPSGLVTKIAGTGAEGSSNGLGLTASFLRPCGMAADAAGNIVVSDCGNNPDGSFTYEQGKKIIFSVGKILLGSINAGKSIVTPMDLVEGGAVSSSNVSNMVRFLIMLDDDGNPSNGVRISPTTQLIATNSAQVDFSQNSSTFASNVNSIISKINAADGGSHSLLTTDAAISYLTNTVRCAWSGAYEGPYSGASVSGAVTDRGKAYFIIHPVTGIGTGGYVGTTNIGDNYSGALQGTQSMGLNNQGAIVIGTGGAGTAFNGRFNTADNISGTWSSVRNPDDPKNGIFTVSRVGGLPSAKYRFTGASSDNMIIVFDISGGALNIVSGVLLNPATGISENINGTLSGILLSAQSTTGVSLTATINLSDGTVSNGRRGVTSFNATGCSLI
jgi:sugar lactone lactonase YvrE